MDAVHYGGSTEYNVHNLYGLMQSKATYDYLKSLSDLPFILGRSTFYGSGKYISHWTGDINSTWLYLRYSVPSIFNFNLFGIPMTGADICGFGLDTTEELCARWFQLGSLYPFARNHNHMESKSQEPYVLGPVVLEAARESLLLRYALLKHYYMLFLEKKGAGTIFRPLFFEFPNEQILYDTNQSYSETQFMIGKSLMAAPVVKEGKSDVEVYFPQDSWFDLVVGSLVRSQRDPSGIVSYPAPLNSTIPLFLRGGNLIGIQKAINVMRTDDLDNLYQLLIAFKSQGNGVYASQGNIIGISNFSDSNIVNKCQKNECLYEVSATLTPKDSSFDLAISFKALSSDLEKDNIGLFGLFLMVDWDSGLNIKNHPYSIPYKEPVSVYDGLQINLQHSY